jgi:hypothetical protein
MEPSLFNSTLNLFLFTKNLIFLSVILSVAIFLRYSSLFRLLFYNFEILSEFLSLFSINDENFNFSFSFINYIKIFIDII